MSDLAYPAIFYGLLLALSAATVLAYIPPLLAWIDRRRNARAATVAAHVLATVADQRAEDEQWRQILRAVDASRPEIGDRA